MIKKAKSNLTLIGKPKDCLKDKTVIADTGYFSEENIKFASDNNIDAYIPDTQFRKRDLKFSDRDRFKEKSKNRIYKINDFIYGASKDQFICPGGKILELNDSYIKFHHYEGKRYMCKQKYCNHCKLKKKCLKNKQAKKTKSIHSYKKE